MNAVVVDLKAELIKVLVPTGLWHMKEGLEQEVKVLAVYGVFGNKALVQRCEWRKREIVVSYFRKSMQAPMRRKLREAYREPAYEKAKEKLLGIRKELELINRSAASGLDEGLEEILTLHRLGLFGELMIGFKTTTCVESLMALIGKQTNKVLQSH